MVWVLVSTSRSTARGTSFDNSISGIVELNSAGSSNVNVVYDQQPVSTMGKQEDSTAMNGNTAAIPDISTNNERASLSGVRSQHDQNSHTCIRGSIYAARRIPDKAVVVPCSATLVSVSEGIVSEDVDVCCEEFEIGVDTSVVPSLSNGLENVSEQPMSEDMDV